MIGHSQFEKIPLSDERQKMYLQKQIDDVVAQTAALKAQRAENFTIKQMERMKKQLQRKLDKLNDQSRKDDVITFEELGVDKLFVDEAHGSRICSWQRKCGMWRVSASLKHRSPLICLQSAGIWMKSPAGAA